MPPRRSARAPKAATPPPAAAPTPSPPPAAKAASGKPPLSKARVAAAGAFAGLKPADILKRAKDLGMATTDNVTKTVTHLISTQTAVDDDAPAVRRAAGFNTPIVSVDWLEACEKDDEWVEEAPYLITKGAAPAPSPAKPKGKAAANGAGAKRAASPSPDAKPAPKKAKKADTKADVKDEVKDEAKPEANGHGQKLKKKDTVVPVDDGCMLVGASVHIGDDGTIWDASLNQTNASNNNNKFYRIQVLKLPGGQFKAWTRWGRVGEPGANAQLGGGDVASAISNFEKKFKDKSGLAWANRLDPAKKGKYTFVERSYEDDSDDEGEAGDGDDVEIKEEEEYVPPECTLSQPVQELMQLIFNQQYLQATMASLNYDANKLPLGKLSKSTITRGFQALKDLGELIDDPTLAQSKYDTNFPSACEHLSNSFYSLIPHAFGRNRPPVINTDAMLKREIELLESLGDMKEAAAIMKAERPRDTIHVLDRHYNALNMDEMTPLEHESKEFEVLSKYLVDTRGATHNVNYKVEEIFRIERQGETKRFDESIFSSVKSDRRLLWHGSRATNFGGILSQGLRIAPPEAPVSGYMFGKGIYLADMSSKSANYCCSYITGGTALLLLCEAELGDPIQKLTNASYTAGDDAKKNGMYSTFGQGRVAPLAWKDAGEATPALKGIKMPDTSKVQPGDTKVDGAYLMYNEFIVYDVSQVKLRYLLRVKM
ncbi:hypothetical protein Q8F55_006098 [Vanrija albida]|uniref:Poly [ADP-ribose] polymerase n=1 Tax=Vanrija albida TaxID=181172 RepID=A0ABR3Q3P4_9TREE